MTPEQALDILYRASQLAHMPAADHAACARAAQTLRDRLTPPPAEAATCPPSP